MRQNPQQCHRGKKQQRPGSATSSRAQGIYNSGWVADAAEEKT